MTRASSFAETLRRYRLERGMTQEELAERAGVSARAVSDIERGLRKRVYRDTARRLADALGLGPDARPGFEAASKGARDLQDATLPYVDQPFLGRGTELGRAESLLRDGSVRLLTIVGPGGVGKTRLALEAARSCMDAFGDGAFFVPISPDVTAEALPDAIRQVIGVPSLERSLGTTETLLLLDTFEHVLDAAPWVAGLLDSCRKLKVLVTSRIPLEIRPEHQLLLGPLEADAGAELLMYHARRVDPKIAVRPEDATAISRVVDGVPLAIEIAAARLRHLTVDSLIEMLDRPLETLVGTKRDVPERQRTMRDTVAWSFSLLDEALRRRCAELSVFTGGFTLDGARAVVGDDAVRVVSDLVDNSLLTRSPDGRYRMFDVVREFAAEGLLDDRPAASGRAAFLLRLAEQAESELGGAHQDEWFATLDDEHDNIRAALAFAVRMEDAEVAARLASAVWQYWRERGLLTEGRTWLREALALDPAPVLRAKALWGAAWLAYHQGDLTDAERLSVELLALARKHPDDLTVRNALTIRGMVALASDRDAEAERSFEEAVDVGRRLGRWFTATSLLNLGNCLVHRGDMSAAERHLDEARSLYREIGDRRFEQRANAYLAHVAYESGDIDTARRLAVGAAREANALGDDSTTVEALETLAVIDSRERVEDAARVVGVAQALRERSTARTFPFHERWMERSLRAAREAIGSDAWLRCVAEGRELDPGDVVSP